MVCTEGKTMKKLSHTIALIWIDDNPQSGQIQQVHELFALHLSRAILFALFINLAALAYLLRDTVASVKTLWNDGIFALAWLLLILGSSKGPLRFNYCPG